jgi:glycosyltransferase involved in cell wall biosynthesis
MLAAHRILGTWQNRVNAYIALTNFAREKFVTSGLPKHKIHVKPNFLPADPGLGSGVGGYGLFIGRLVEEKGLYSLLDAWESLPPEIPLRIVGDGPLKAYLEQRLLRLPHIQWIRRPSREELWKQLRNASFLVVPSIWYEGLPMVIVEALAVGCPVIASELGSLSTLIRHQVTGLLFRPGSAAELASRVSTMCDDSKRLLTMRRNARQEYLDRFTAEANYRQLMRIYHHALAREADAPATTAAQDRT